MSEQILRLSALIECTGLSSASIYRYAAKGEFPTPIKLGQRSSGWLRSEVDQWISDRIIASRGPKEASDV